MCLRCYIGSSEWMEEAINLLPIVGRVELDYIKTKQLLGRQPKHFVFSFLIFSLLMILGLC